MKLPHKRFQWMIVLVLLFSLLLSACGPDDSGDSASDAPAESSTDNSAPTDNSAKPAEESGNSIGSVTSDLGFRPEKNGFAFENYGNDVKATNLTAAELERMFGEQVCSRKKDGKCVLVPAGKQWLKEINAMMAGGHCEGFAVLSLLMYSGSVQPQEFDGSTAHQLSLDNEKLQREIAYWWATQATEPTTTSLIKGTPEEILKVLQNLGKTSETYTLGIYKRDGSGGHAITPFAVENDGSGVYSVLVYDNNYPNETRKLQINVNDNTWSYEASINPATESELYEGDADTQTLDLTPTSARTGLQACPFCAESSASRSGLAAAAQKYNQFFLEGEGNLIIEDMQGHQLGYVNGKFVNAIPGALVQAWRMQSTFDQSFEPVYLVPDGVDVKITVDGSGLKQESLTDLVMVGPGFTIGVESIGLTPGQKDLIEFYPNDETIVYDTESAESPTFVVGVEQPGAADYEFVVEGADMESGGTITVALDTKKGDLFVNTEKLTNEGKFYFEMTRYTENDEETFAADEIALKAGAVVWINYAEWKGNGTGIYFGVDTNGDDVIDDEYEVSDAQ